MPIYLYVCSSCETKQEHIHKWEEPPPSCGRCEAKLGKKERQICAPSFRLERGVGWDGWDYVAPGVIGREVPVEKHIDEPCESRNPGSKKVTSSKSRTDLGGLKAS